MIGNIQRELKILTPADVVDIRKYGEQSIGRIFRPATMAEAAQLGVRVGSIIRDPREINQYALRVAALRQEAKDAVAAAEKAAKENANRQPPPPPPKKGNKQPVSRQNAPTPNKTKAPRFDGDDGSYTAWKNRLSSGKWAHEDGGSDD